MVDAGTAIKFWVLFFSFIAHVGTALHKPAYHGCHHVSYSKMLYFLFTSPDTLSLDISGAPSPAPTTHFPMCDHSTFQSRPPPVAVLTDRWVVEPAPYDGTGGSNAWNKDVP